MACSGDKAWRCAGVEMWKMRRWKKGREINVIRNWVKDVEWRQKNRGRHQNSRFKYIKMSDMFYFITIRPPIKIHM